jgi:hypothetical protein
MPRPLKLLLCALLVTTAAQAEPAAKKQAGALFDEGRRLLTAGRFDEACTRFAESEKLDPSSGTLLNLADCHERRGQLASALQACRESERLATTPDGRAFAAHRAEELEPRVPSLVFDANARRVSVDGAASTKPFFVDAGKHRVEVTFDDGTTRAIDVDVTAHEQRVTFPVEPPPVAAPPPPPPPSRADRTWAIVAGAGGVAGIAVGTIAGIVALSKKNDVTSLCGADFPAHCANDTPAARSDLSDAHGMATISTVGFISGAALLALGVVLYATDTPGAQSLLCPIGMPCLRNSARR